MGAARGADAHSPLVKKHLDSNGTLIYRIEYGAVRSAVMHRLEHGSWEEPLASQGISSSIMFDRFTGGSEAKIKKWLTKGFDVKAARENEHAVVYAKERRRMRWSDDGDLDVGQALAGADFPFAQWDRRLRKPGLAIVAEYAFNSNVPGSMLAEYGAWVVEQVKRFELAGYDLDVSVVMPIRSLFIGDGGRNSDIMIILKREGEASDSRAWGPMFSPAGFRCLGFTAIYMASRDLKQRVTAGIGHAHANHDWGVLFNSQTRTMRLLCPANGRVKFDPERMTRLLNDALPEA